MAEASGIGHDCRKLSMQMSELIRDAAGIRRILKVLIVGELVVDMMVFDYG